MRARLIVFLSAFVAAYLPLSFIYDHLHQRREHFIVTEFDSIQAQIELRFRLYNRSAVVLSKLATQFWQQPNVSPEEFATIGETVLSINPEAIGANFIAPDGRITQIYPVEENSRALGKTSQNISALQSARQNNMPIWLSPPFELFQGEPGFVYYFALQRGDKFQGWYGIVISQRRFLEQFLANQQFDNFHVDLRDSSTGKSYIQTAPLPSATKYVRTTQFEALGRSITLQSWPKDAFILSTILPLVTSLALVIAVLVTLAAHFYLHRRQIQRHQTQLNALLDHVIQDTAESLRSIKGHVELMKSDPRLVPLDRMNMHLGFVVELVEQIKVMRGLAELEGKRSQGRQQLLPLVLEALEILNDRMRSHHLVVDYNPDELAPLQVNLNERLFVHAVLANLLGIFISLAPDRSTITLSTLQENGNLRLRLGSTDVLKKLERSDELSLNIAHKVMEYHEGRVERVSSQPLSIDVLIVS